MIMILKSKVPTALILLTLLVSVSAKRSNRRSLVCPKDPLDFNTEFKPAIVFYRAGVDKDVRIESIVGLNRWHEDNVKSFMEHGFDLKLPTLIYSHGYTESDQILWLVKMRKRYAELGAKGHRGCNLLFFDWSTVSTKSYPEAVSFVPNLGRSLAQFMLQMNETYSYGPDKFHAITFSLSNHIVGMAGRYLKSKHGLELGQITSLDPTGVCFHDNSQFGETYKLRISDAKFVVARHYDRFAFGAHQNIGLVDIFVNGGEHQTVMNKSFRDSEEHSEVPEHDRSIVGNAIDKFFSHFKTLEHEMNPKPDDCFEVAYQCDDYETFSTGACGSCGRDNSRCYYINNLDEAQRLHLGSPFRQDHRIYKPNTLMFIKTTANMTCLQHYQVIASFRVSDSADSSALDELIIGRRVVFRLDSVQYIEPKFRISQGIFTELITRPLRLDLPEEIKLEVELEDGFGLVVQSLKSVEVRFMSHPLREMRRKLSATYCPTERTFEDAILVKC